MEGKMASLLLNCEGVGLAMHVLVSNFFMIGRAPSNQIVVDHPTISAQHAVLLRVGDSFWLKDLNSTNGTQINGVLVNDAKLKDGDTIRFGSALGFFAGRCRKRRPSRGIRKFRPEQTVNAL